MNMEVLMQYMSYILTGIGVLAFLVSAIVQTIKEMPELPSYHRTDLHIC